MINIIFGAIMIVLILSIVNSSSQLLFYYQESNIKTRRLNQLKKMKNKEKSDYKEIIDKISDSSNKSLIPRLRRVFPSLNKVDLSQLERNLKLVGWDKTFTPESFIGTVWGLRIGVIPLSLLFLVSTGLLKIFFLAGALACAFGLESYLDSEVKSLKDKLFAEFPDFIRIVSGYLSADIPLVKSITDSIKYVGDAWEPILKTFVVDCDNKSVDFALERMKNTVDLFEVKEFISLIRLTLEQGGKAKDGFLTQASKVEELQKNQLVLKVGKRKMMGTIVQAPLLLINMIIIALPTVSQLLVMLGDGGMGGMSITGG